MLVHRMVKKVKDSKVWAKINTRDGGPGSGIKGHTTAEEPTQVRPAAKAEEPAKSGEGKSFVSKEHAQAYINGAAKTASKLLGAGVKQGYTGFEWSKKGGYADAKMKLTRMKIEKAGFKEVDFDQADHPAGNWTRNTTIFQNENGDVIKMTSRYGETSRQNSHSVAYIPKDFNKAKERLYAQDSDPRGYKVSDQIIKGFLIYKSGKGPATYFAKNENGKEFEGTMEQIKKQIDDYWVKQDEDVMKQKVKDGQSYNMAVEYELFTYYNIPGSQARQIVERNSQELQKKEDANITVHNAAEMLIHKEGIKGFEKIYVTQGDSKTKDEVFTDPRYVLYHTKWKGLDISQLKDKTIVWENNRQLKSINGGDYDALAKAQDWIDAFRRKTKDKAYHPRWRIKDDKLFRLRSAIKKVKRVKDVELSNRAVWRKEDFDKMVAAGNFTIVSKQPWGYEVKVKSGNIYGVEIKDTYTKGSADRKTKDVNLMFEFLIKIVKEGTGVSTSVAEKAVSKLLDAEGPISAGVDNSVIIRKAKKYLPSKDSFTYTKGSADKKTKDEEISYKGYHISKGQHETGLSGYKIDNPNGRRPLMDFYKTIGDAKEAIDKFGIYLGKDSKSKDATIEFHDFNKWKEFCISKGYRVVKTDKYNTLAHTEGKLMGGFHSRANSGWVEPSVQSARYSYGSKDSKDTYTKGSADKKTKDQINPEYIRKRKILVDQLERAKKNRAPIETVENITDMIKKLDEDYDRGSAKDKYTGDPLTKKGQKIMAAMREKYGKKKGESVFYASKNKGTISGVDGKTRDYRQPKTVKYKGFEIDPYFGQFSDGDIGDETYLIYKNNKLVVSKEFYTVEEAKAYIDKKYK